MRPHRVIDGRIYYDVELKAADVYEARRHISAAPPVSYATQQRVRAETQS